MTINERAKIIPDEALTNHHIQDNSVDFTREDISNAYVAGAKDVINIINDIIKIEMLQADIDERFPDYKGIVEDIINADKENRSCIILSERVEHIEKLANMLEGKITNLFVINGNMKNKDIKTILQKIKEIPQTENVIIF